MTRLRSLAIVAGTAFVLCAAPADAASVHLQRFGAVPISPTGGAAQVVLHIDAAPGESNHMSIAFDPAARAWTIRDTGTPPAAGDYCTVAGDTATCAPPSGDSMAALYGQIDLGDGDDQLDLSDARSALDVDPGDGDDSVHIAAGTPNVSVKSSPGADSIASEDGGTVLDYSTATSGISVTPDGVADDGTANEHDNITGIFGKVLATPYDDHVVASAAPLDVLAGDGNDTLTGGPADDILDAGNGSNTVDAGAGDDFVSVLNEPGVDTVSGGPGHDRLNVSTAIMPPAPQWSDVEPAGLELPGARTLTVRYARDFEGLATTRGHIVGTDADETLAGNGIVDGAAGNDTISGTGMLIGGSGRDTFLLNDAPANIHVRAADGQADVIRCNMGRTLPLDMHVDKLDTAAIGCDPPLKAALTTRRVRVDRHGAATIKLTCAAARCKGRAYVRGGTTNYAQGSFTIEHGQTKKVSLKVAIRWRGKGSIAGSLYVKATPLLWAHGLTLGAVTLTSSSASP